MTVAPDLLQKVRATGAALAEAECQVLVARGEYHAAIRRLHLAGAPLREIAEVLSLSHQRVQQIVEASGGSWWRRAWRTRNVGRGAVCTWCGRPPSEVAKLVAGPNVFICDRCLHAAESALAGEAAGALRIAKARGKDRCAFCRRRGGEQRSIVIGPSANICSECMRLCREFMGTRGDKHVSA